MLIINSCNRPKIESDSRKHGDANKMKDEGKYHIEPKTIYSAGWLVRTDWLVGHYSEWSVSMDHDRHRWNWIENPPSTEMSKCRSKLPSVHGTSLVCIVVPADGYKYRDPNGGAHAAGCDVATVTSRGAVAVEIRGTSWGSRKLIEAMLYSCWTFCVFCNALDAALHHRLAHDVDPFRTRQRPSTALACANRVDLRVVDSLMLLPISSAKR